MSVSPEPLARLCAKRPWTTIGIWVLVLVLGFVIVATLLSSALTTAFRFTNTPESQRALDLMEKLRGPIGTNEVVIIQSVSDDLNVDSPAFQNFVEEELFSKLDALGPEVIKAGTLINYYQARAPFLVSENRLATIIPFTMAGDYDDSTDNIDKVLDVVATAKGNSDFKVLIAGQATVGKSFQEISQEDLEKGESIGIPIALIILVLVLGALVAALVPIVLAFVSIIIAMGIAALVGQVFQLSFFVTNLIFTIGLAVGIDYSLFIVARFREERTKGLEKLDAIGRAGATATRAVVFSVFTVVLALFGMVLIPFNIFIGIALGAIFVVIVAMIASLTLLPAVLGLLGDGINRMSIPFVGRAQERFDETRPGGFWDRVSHGVMRLPLVSLIVAGGLLIAASVPFFGIQTGFAGVSSMPEDVEAREGFLVLDELFSQGEATPAAITIEGDIDSPSVQASIGKLKGLCLQKTPISARPGNWRSAPGEIWLYLRCR